jgi:signal transduction histidine kinase
MLSQAAEPVQTGARSSEAFERFYASIAEGLHELAQPLTILRSSIAAANAEDATQERQRYYLDISKSQVERACELFESLQQTAIVAQTGTHRGPFEGELP